MLFFILFLVLDFFSSRTDAEKLEGAWSVEKVLQVTNISRRFWRLDGMKVIIDTSPLC